MSNNVKVERIWEEEELADDSADRKLLLIFPVFGGVLWDKSQRIVD